MAGALLLAAAQAWATGGAHTELTSVGPGGLTVHGDASTFGGQSLSANGRRALFSVNDDGLPGADGTRDVYVRDRKSDQTKLVSKSTSGDPANATCSDDLAISADGRFAAFPCDATNLGGGTGGIFVRDLRNGTTKLVSRRSDGQPAGGASGSPALSANGRFVAFAANSDDLPGMDGTNDAYVRDRRKGTTTLVSKTTSGDEVDNTVQVNPSISADGRFVAFNSSSDLLPGRDGVIDVYVRDRKQGKTILASRNSAGVTANGNTFAYGGALSADGRLVAFESNASNLSGTVQAAVVRDLVRRKTRIVSRTTGGDPAIGYEPVVSADGRYVVYDSDDDDLPGRDGTSDILRYDRKTKKTVLVSKSNGGKAGTDSSYYAAISRDGGFVAFSSYADNLSGLDDNAVFNAFVRGPLG